MIYLKYNNNPALIGDDDDDTVLGFEELTIESRPVVDVVAGRTKRGNAFRHVTGKRRKYELQISTDAIDTEEKNTFLEKFFVAQEQYFGYTSGGLVQIVVNGGDMQTEPLDGVRMFRNVKFEFELVVNGSSKIADENIVDIISKHIFPAV